MSDSGEHTFSMILIPAATLFTTYIYIYIHKKKFLKKQSVFKLSNFYDPGNTSNRLLTRFPAGNEHKNCLRHGSNETLTPSYIPCVISCITFNYQLFSYPLLVHISLIVQLFVLYNSKVIMLEI